MAPLYVTVSDHVFVCVPMYHIPSAIITVPFILRKVDRGNTVVKVLCYKSEGRWFDSRWCHLKFSLTYSLRSHYGPGVDSPPNRNEYQEYFLGVKEAGA